MKNLLLLLVLVGGAYYLYVNPRAETALEPVAADAAPAPVAPPQKAYFHSPLDASAMSTRESTGTGYYSADPNSRFTTYQGGYSSSFQAAGGYPVYTGTTNNTAIINNYGGGAGTSRAPVSTGTAYISGRVPSHNASRRTSADRQPSQNNQRNAN